MTLVPYALLGLPHSGHHSHHVTSLPINPGSGFSPVSLALNMAAPSPALPIAFTWPAGCAGVSLLRAVSLGLFLYLHSLAGDLLQSGSLKQLCTSQ